MPNEMKSDEQLANDFERILESEHGVRLIYMRATGKSYEEATQALEKAQERREHAARAATHQT